MTDQITRETISKMIAGASKLIRQQHRLLSELDSVAGDGDHGATMLRSMDRLEQSFTADAPADFKSSFYQAGWNVLGADGGASSSLLGAFFLGMADSPETGACSLNGTGLANAFDAGLRNVKNQTTAQPGDKTMMDALTPAVERFVATTGSEGNIASAFREAALAARNGAEATKLLTARYGRAKLLGEKTKGYMDPGAMSIALIFEGFYQGITELKGELGNG